MQVKGTMPWGGRGKRPLRMRELVWEALVRRWRHARGRRGRGWQRGGARRRRFVQELHSVRRAVGRGVHDPEVPECGGGDVFEDAWPGVRSQPGERYIP